MDKLLTGEHLPTFEQLGALLFHMATNEARPIEADHEEVAGCGYLGESSARHVWLIYRPDLAFLKSRDAALTLSRAQALATVKPDKAHLVFAPARFVSQRVLEEAKLAVKVEFAPLPWALYRVERPATGSQAPLGNPRPKLCFARRPIKDEPPCPAAATASSATMPPTS